MQKSDPSDHNTGVEHYLRLQEHASKVLGPANWAKLRAYGKIMDGSQNGGSYVSGVSVEDAWALVDALVAGGTVQVHLMHRHRSGCYETSDLCLRAGRLVMLFKNQSEFA